MSDRYLTKAEYSNAKRRLTRAENKLKAAQAVEGSNLEAVMKAAVELYGVARAQMQEWEDADKAFPDDWHRWQRAEEDAASLVIRLGRW